MADAVGVEPTQSDLESNSPPGNMGACRKDLDERDPKAKNLQGGRPCPGWPPFLATSNTPGVGPQRVLGFILPPAPGWNMEILRPERNSARARWGLEKTPESG